MFGPFVCPVTAKEAIDVLLILSVAAKETIDEFSVPSTSAFGAISTLSVSYVSVPPRSRSQPWFLHPSAPPWWSSALLWWPSTPSTLLWWPSAPSAPLWLTVTISSWSTHELR